MIEAHPEAAAALVTTGGSTTYGELRERVGRLRGGLVQAGVERGERVAILAGNGPVFVVGYLAVVGAGAVAVPLDPLSPVAELEGQLSAVGATTLLVGPGTASGSPHRLPVERVFAAAGVDVAGASPLEGLLGADPVPIAEVADDGLAVLAFTGGTAGAPRAAMLSHGNLRANLEQVQAHPGLRVTSRDVVFGVLPMSHVFGLNVVLGLALFAGASVLPVERFDPVGALDAIREHGVTVVVGVPPMYRAWVALARADPGGFATVRLAVSGAAALAPETATSFEARFGVPVRQGYGLTEAGPVVTSGVTGRPLHAGSVGVPLPGVGLRLVDADGGDVLAGDAGEIWVRGPNVFEGYWDDPRATAAALTPDGWLRTGDVGVADDDGSLHLVDRLKDLVVVSGFNVYPAEVEAVLRAHPGVADVAVVGVEDARTGEAVRAVVVPEPGSEVDAGRLIAFCAGRLARYKCPTEVAFVEELPLGNAGKVLRRQLRAP